MTTKPNFKHKFPWLLAAIGAASLLSACGGGDDATVTSTTNTVPTTSAQLTGTVPGTLIQAFCSDGSSVSVASVQDGTTQHPFTLNLPYQTDCRIVMVTNEGTANQVITPLTFNGVSVINLQTSLDLGYVPLAMSPAEITDSNGDGVVDMPLNIAISNLPAGVTLNTLAYDPMDTDADGIPNVYEDDDNDGIVNKDDDEDNRYIVDATAGTVTDFETGTVYNISTGTVSSSTTVTTTIPTYTYTFDTDRDGIDDLYDRDDDNDGIYDDDDDDRYEYDSDDYRWTAYSDHDDDDDDNHSDDYDDRDYTTSDTTTNYVPTYAMPTAYQLTTGRLLSSQCAQCHGTNGRSVNGWDSLVGEDIRDEWREILAGDEDPIMTAQAHGYTDAEVAAMDAWFRAQR